MPQNKMHADEVDISPELIRYLLVKQFPQWVDLPLRAMQPEGTDNAMYKLGGNKLIRLPRTKSSSLNIEKELTWLPKLEPQLPIPIPKIIGKGLPDKNYPFPWLVCVWLDGLNPDREGMINEHKAAKDMGTFVKAMHKIQDNGGPNCRRGKPLSTCNEAIIQSIPFFEEHCDIELLRELWQSALKVPQWEKDPVWIHGDLHPGNLLAKDGKLVGVVDFGLTGIGDPACDMMIAWTLLSKKTRDIFRSIVQPDDHTWSRGRGWALFLGIVGYPYYRVNNPIFANIAMKTLDEVIADYKEPR